MPALTLNGPLITRRPCHTSNSIVTVFKAVFTGESHPPSGVCVRYLKRAVPTETAPAPSLSDAVRYFRSRGDAPLGAADHNLRQGRGGGAADLTVKRDAKTGGQRQRTEKKSSHGGGLLAGILGTSPFQRNGGGRGNPLAATRLESRH